VWVRSFDNALAVKNTACVVAGLIDRIATSKGEVDTEQLYHKARGACVIIYAEVKKTAVYTLAFICLFVALRFGARSWGRRPSDAKLIKQFYDNRNAFEKLREMLQQDAFVTRIAGDGISTAHTSAGKPEEIGFPPGRYVEYVTALKQAGALSAIRDRSELRFPVAVWGFAGKGWRIAVTWRESPPSPLIPSLDDFGKTINKWDQAYRRIEGNWYLWIIW